MINITRKDIEKLLVVGSGNFGKVYRNGNMSYKIYHEKIKTTEKEIVKNPSLKY